MAETLNINRERRALRVLERLDKRRLQGKFDFTIIVGKQKILAEQNVLASGSDYFEAMLSYDTKERQKGEVEMFDVDFESVETCIGFIYGREVTVSIEKYEKVMFVARMMQLEELCDAMEEEMRSQLRLNTFFIIRSVALKFSLAGLVDTCKWFAECNLGLLCLDENFSTLEKTFIVEMMKSDRVEMEEEDKLKMLVDWVKLDVERSEGLLGLLKYIDYSKISKEVGHLYVVNEPLIKDNMECLHFFSSSMLQPTPPVVPRSENGIRTVEYNVPKHKTGQVIGKGGGTIKNINLQSQAHVEIQRNQPPGNNRNFNTFLITGAPDQIAHAQQLIRDKVEARQGERRTHPDIGQPRPKDELPGDGPPIGFVAPPQPENGEPPHGPAFGVPS